MKDFREYLKESEDRPYAAFHAGKQHTVHAGSLYDAKKKAVAHFKPKKSQEHMVHVHLADVEHVATESLAEGKIERTDFIYNKGANKGHRESMYTHEDKDKDGEPNIHRIYHNHNTGVKSYTHNGHISTSPNHVHKKMAKALKRPDLVESVEDDKDKPPIQVRSLYAHTYAKHGGTIAKSKSAKEKAYATVEKKHGSDMATKLKAWHDKNYNESLDEGTHYHSVWYKHKDQWNHHTDADNHEDAKHERDYLKNGGEKAKIIRVHKDQADWRKPEHVAAARAKLDGN